MISVEMQQRMSLQEYVDKLVKLDAGPDAGIRFLQDFQAYTPKADSHCRTFAMNTTDIYRMR